MVLAPWVIRNSLILGEFVGISSETSEWFWRGNNAMVARGDSSSPRSPVLPGGADPLDRADPGFRARILAADEVGRMRLYRDAAAEFVREEPGRFIGLVARKFFYFWWFRPESGILYPGAWLVIYATFYSALLVLAAGGFFRCLFARAWMDRADLIVVAGFLFSISLTQALFYVEGRHRWGIEPVLLMLAGGGSSWFLRWAGFRPPRILLRRPGIGES
ncbi:MAG: hypothetical protein M3380_17295 [Chloroflexota bacterium]|nr:hypothetical protein [Chloroflexota bacterium]